MRRFVDKIIRREEDKKLCPQCEETNSEDNDCCQKCGYDFTAPRTSTPEDGMND